MTIQPTLSSFDKIIDININISQWRTEWTRFVERKLVCIGWYNRDMRGGGMFQWMSRWCNWDMRGCGMFQRYEQVECRRRILIAR